MSVLLGTTPGSTGPAGSTPWNIHEGPKSLSPDQVVELAESLKSPVLAHDQEEEKQSSLSRSSSYRRRTAFGGQGAYDAAAQQQQREKDKVAEQLELEPVEYVEMQDDVLLPFVDRPAEVAELFENAYNKELLEIIRPTFPTESKADPSRAGSWRNVPPAEWTWDEFKLHLQENRADCDDLSWVRLLRLAVRARSEAIWEKIGVCIGCDADLLAVGDMPDPMHSPMPPLSDVFDTDDEIGTPMGGNLAGSLIYSGDEGVGFEGDDDARVCIQPIVPVEASEEEPESESGFDSSFSEGGAGRTASPQPVQPVMAAGAMETIGEEGGESSGGSGTQTSRPTPSQVAGGRGEQVDPLLSEISPATNFRPLPSDVHESPKSARSETSNARKLRGKSFVGLQITTAPSKPASHSHQQHRHSFFPSGVADHPHFERGPGSPLFPSSFSSLSLAPTLPNNNPNLRMGRSSFSGFGGALSGTGGASRQNIRATMAGMGTVRPWMTELQRKKSTGGMSRVSDSALTFGSDTGDDIVGAA
jgi:hypothetical protein